MVLFDRKKDVWIVIEDMEFDKEIMSDQFLFLFSSLNPTLIFEKISIINAMQ
jgi:hypothetical protein